MKALDTNVLVRFLVKDEEHQARSVYKIFKEAENKKDVFFIPVLVVMETIWVLEAVYSVNRQEILNALDELLLMPILEFEMQRAVRSFISSAREIQIDLSDLLIAHAAKFSGCDRVITFDKRASAFELFELLK